MRATLHANLKHYQETMTAFPTYKMSLAFRPKRSGDDKDQPIDGTGNGPSRQPRQPRRSMRYNDDDDDDGDQPITGGW